MLKEGGSYQGDKPTGLNKFFTKEREAGLCNHKFFAGAPRFYNECEISAKKVEGILKFKNFSDD